MKFNPSRLKLTLLIGIGALAIAGVVVYASTATILGVGSMPYSELVDGPATLTARRLIIPVNDPPSAWHYHPGFILSTVGDVQAPIENTGSVTIEDGCGTSETFGPGQSFHQLDGRVHRAVNYSNGTVEEHNMFVNPQGSPLTVTLSERRCGPPRSADECMNDGWAMFDFPATFGNQGACVKYVTQRRKVSVLIPEPLP